MNPKNHRSALEDDDSTSFGLFLSNKQHSIFFVFVLKFQFRFAFTSKISKFENSQFPRPTRFICAAVYLVLLLQLQLQKSLSSFSSGSLSLFWCPSLSFSANEEKDSLHQFLRRQIQSRQMTTTTKKVLSPSAIVVTVNLLLLLLIAVVVVIFPSVLLVHGFGSASTLAISHGSGTVCGILAGKPYQRIECYREGGVTIPIGPNISYDSISGGRDFFCGLRAGGFSFLCWNSTFQPKRIYFNYTVALKDLSVGENHVCALEVSTGVANCWWRGDGGRFRFLSPKRNELYVSITSGRGFSCGILKNNSSVRCWGINSTIAGKIQNQFKNFTMSSLVAGYSHVCGLKNDNGGSLICKGRNDSRQLDVPFDSSAYEFSSLALGVDHSCALRRMNGSVVCWGGDGRYSSSQTKGILFESIVAGSNFTCGLTARNLSVICWGPGWSRNSNPGLDLLPLPKIVPGPCTQEESCSSCGIFPDSETLCSGSGNICKQCDIPIIKPPIPPPSWPPPPIPLPPGSSPPSSSFLARQRGLLIFLIVGSVGIFSGICTIIYCLWTGICCCRQKKIHNSVQPTITGTNNANGASMGSGRFTRSFSRSSTIRRQSSRAMRRQRSGTSSKHPERAEEFSLSELAEATDGFSLANKIGAGSFGTVYKGKLPDGREVAIKRGETNTKTRKFQEKESAFESELAFLSRLHHKHLVALVGYCEENDERLLVYEYMENGALYDHLHSKKNTQKTSSFLNSWKLRIKISLDAARGIEYLHNYAVPPIIHRDIKSSNILLDANWIGRVSDFGLSLLGPKFEGECMSAKAAGTVGYMDPEYYGLNVLTSKSDVYGLGVVLLELLTGRRAIFKDEEGGGPTSIVDYAVEKIMAGELGRILDARVGAPQMNEGEAVELLAYTAVHCVNLEGKERPSMSDIVANLERAFTLCEDSHGSISSATISVASE